MMPPVPLRALYLERESAIIHPPLADLCTVAQLCPQGQKEVLDLEGDESLSPDAGVVVFLDN